jgi:hypothetical protein
VPFTEDVSDAALRTAKKSQEWAKGRWGDFRQESPYFQAKVWLVVGYVGVVILTLLIAPPEGDHWVVKQERINFGLTFKTAVAITNVDNGDVEDAVVEVRGKGIEFDGKEIPGTWSTKKITLVEDTTTKVFSEQLSDKNGGIPPYTLQVDYVRILDDDGDVLFEVAPSTIEVK